MIQDFIENHKLPVGETAEWLVDVIKSFPGLLNGIRSVILWIYTGFESFFCSFRRGC